MKTLFRILFLTLLSTSTFAQIEVSKGQSLTASQSTRFRLGADANRMGQSNNTGAFSPFALFSDLTGLLTQSTADARYPQLSGSYANPTWITSLAFSKLSGTPTTIAGYGITDAVSTGGSYTNPTWLVSIPFSKLTATPTTRAGYGITDAQATITTGAATQYLKGDLTLGTFTTDVRAALSATAPLVFSGGAFSIPAATASVPGYLTAADFTTFSGKQSPATTLAGYGITDASPFTIVADFATLNAVTLPASTFKDYRVTSDERFGDAKAWYRAYADPDGTMHLDRQLVDHVK